MDYYIETGDQELKHLPTEIEKGLIKIPQFQRDFVWDVDKVADLIESMLRQYPIGALIYWRTADRLREVRDLGGIEFKRAGQGERVNYVLDGQQRLTSILAALYGLEVKLRDGSEKDFTSLMVHLDRGDEDSPIVRTDCLGDDSAVCVPLVQIWNRKGNEFDSCDGKLRDERDEYSDMLRTYRIPKVTLVEADVSVAAEVFSRINTTGTPLDVFEIMVAKTYDPDRNFDLFEKYEEFSEELQDASFGSITATNILQLIALMLKNDCKKKTILNLDRTAFIDTWPHAIENVRAAVDYIKSAFQIPVSRLLPYPSLVIPIALFFQQSNAKDPTSRQAELLANFFWQVGWSERYSSSSDSRLAQDKQTISHIINENHIRFDWAEPVTPNHIKYRMFSTSQAFSKTVLALLATLQPRRYNSDNLVILRNDWMQRANSLNFHHVFPKKFLRDNKFDDWEANRILNISLVDDFLNKRVIRARAPSEYFEEFKDKNDKFQASMSTHLIETQMSGNDGESSAAIWSDDYMRFIEERAVAVVNLLKSKIISED